MRFKAKLAPEQVSFLHSVIVPLSKLSSSSLSSVNTGVGTNNISTSNNNILSNNKNNDNNGIAILSIDNNDLKISCKGRRTGLSSSSSTNNYNNNTSSTDGIITYTELVAYNGIFIEYRIDSIAPNNQIVLEIDLNQLKSALKSIISGNNTTSTSKQQSSSLLNNTDLSTQYTIIKLAKRQNIPCLCLDACTIAGSSNNNATNTTTTNNNNTNTTTTTISGGGLIQIHHAIPVRILRHTEFDEYYLPPVIPLPDIQLELINNTNTLSSSSSITPLRTIIDRLRNMSNIVYLEGTRKGELTIRIHTDGASIRTFYSKLQTRLEGCKPEDQNQSRHNNNSSTSNHRVVMKVDTKKLYTALQWQSNSSTSSGSSASNNPNVSSALLCLIENEMLVVHVTLNPASIGFITYYVPVHYVSSVNGDDD